MGERFRRWFQCAEMDLFVWRSAAGEIEKFQLAYDKLSFEKAITWSSNSGFEHNVIDDGTSTNHYPAAPVLGNSIAADISYIKEQFRPLALEIDPVVREFVIAKLAHYPRTPDFISEQIATNFHHTSALNSPLVVLVVLFLILIAVISLISQYGT